MHAYNEHALNVLEFPAVRGIVASFASSEEGAAELRGLEPLDDPEDIRGRLVEVEECMRALMFDDPLPSVAVADTRELFPRLSIEGHNLGVDGIIDLAANLGVARSLVTYFRGREESYPAAAAIVGGLYTDRDLEERVNRIFTPERTVDDNASSALRSIRRKLERARASLREIVQKAMDSLSDDVLAERLLTIRNGRYVIPVRDTRTAKVNGVVQDRSQTGRTCFIEPLASIEANNTVSDLERAEAEEVERILLELSGAFHAIAGELTANHGLLVRLDVIAAKARYGVKTEATVPEMADDPTLVIKNGRHPLLDWKYRTGGTQGKVVPLNFTLGDPEVTVVITGPNAGGKTVTLKTVGLLTAMALAGLPVTAGGGTVLYRPADIFADIGDEQSIEDDLSTFSSHMRQIVAIVDKVRSGALVLLDELGGGTNPADGEAIALAVLKKLTAERAFTVATTHHEGLKVFAYETEGVANASMEFDNEHLAPSFVLRSGIPGSSYAFEIAGRMGMPKDVLAEAERLSGGERKSLEGLIATMEEHVREAESARADAERERRDLESIRESYETKMAEFRQQRDELMREAVEESRKLVRDSNRSIENAVRAIREEHAAGEAVKKARETVRRQVEKVEKQARKLPKKEKSVARPPVDDLHKDMTAWSASLGTDVVVDEVLDGGKKARVRAGKSPVSMVVGRDDLHVSKAGKKPEQRVNVSVRKKAVDSSEIDLKGKTFDEARVELDMLFDRLHADGYEQAFIIHGKGTGMLRQKIHRWLDTHPLVESYRLGDWNEGGAGITIAKLKR